jgi:hypothetical protein
MIKKISIRKILATPVFLAVLLSVILVTPVFASTIWPVIAYVWGSTALPGDMAMDSPFGVDAVTVDATTARVYVADSNNNRIAIYTVNLTNPISATFVSQIPSNTANPPTPPGALSYPHGVAVDLNGNIYISDSGNNRVLKYDKDGNYLNQASGFFNPTGLAVDPTGTYLYVANTGNGKVMQLSASDLTGAAQLGSTTFTLLQDVATDPTGNYVYAVDNGGTTNPPGRLSKIQVSTGGVANANLGFYAPNGVAVDKAGMIFISESSVGIGQIKKVNWSGANPSVLKTIGSYGTATGYYKTPGAVAAPITSEDIVFVADTGNNRIDYLEPNIAPTDISLDKITLVEDVYTSTHVGVVGTVTITDSNLLDTYSYTMITGTGCADSAKFIVPNPNYPNAGKLITNGNQSFDFESTKTSYQVCIKVSDNSNQMIPSPQYKSFTVNITNGDDNPVITANGTQASPPNPPNSYLIDEYISFNETNSDVTNPNTTIKPGYNIRGSSVTLSGADNDVGGAIVSYQIVGGTFADAFVVNQISGTNNADVVIKDSDAYKTLLDYESNTQGTVIVRATDNDAVGSGKTPNTPNYTDITLTIMLRNKDDYAIVTMPGTPFAIDENVTTNNQIIGDPIVVTDPDTLGTGMGMGFTTTNSYLKFVRTSTSGNTATFRLETTGIGINFENTPSFDLILKSSGGAGFDTAPIHITINDKNDKPVLITPFTLHNTTPVGAVLDLDSSNDANDPLTYTITGGNSLGTFGIVNGQVVIADYTALVALNPLTYSLQLTVQDTRQDPPSVPAIVSGTVTINVSQGNRPPVFVTDPVPTLTVPENTTDGAFVVGYIDATDEDGDPLTFSTNTTDTSNPFTVTTTSTAPWRGKVTVNTNHTNLLNYEAKTYYDLQVTVNDGKASPVTQTYRVLITNVNEQIVFDSLSPAGPTFTTGDRSAVDTVITTINWTDPDAGTQPTFTATGDTDGFNVDSSGNVVKVAPVLHTYLKNSYNLIIFVCDNGIPGYPTPRTCLNTPISVTINLTDDNDPPTFVANTTLSIPEKSSTNTGVGSFTVFDENNNDFTVDISGGSAQEAFGITCTTPSLVSGLKTSTCDIRVIDGTKLDYEMAANHKVTLDVHGTDTIAAESYHTYEISMTDINEAPIFAGQTMSVYERALATTLAGTINATDQDAGDTLSYQITGGNSQGNFAVNSKGEISIVVGKSSNITLQNSPFILTIRVTDSHHLFVDGTVTITITPRADPAIKEGIVSSDNVLIGSSMTYTITIDNLGQGPSSPYTVNLTLPISLGFISAGSSDGCAMQSADTLVCPGSSLNPAGTGGDSHTFTINAYLSSVLSDGSTITTPVEMKTDVNDNSAANNKTNLVFTARKKIAVTDQNFENLTATDLYIQNPDLSLSPITSTTQSTKAPVRNFFGTYSTDTIVFKKDNLLPHSKVEITFDLYLGGNWWGVNNTYASPSYWKLCKGSLNEQGNPLCNSYLLDTTFSTYVLNTNTAFNQNYPDSQQSGIEHAPLEGALKDVLGIDGRPGTSDGIYTIHYGPMSHTDSTAIFEFIGENLKLQDSYKPLWGIDNLKILISGEDSFSNYVPIIRR